jgi:hypothetical protein
VCTGFREEGLLLPVHLSIYGRVIFLLVWTLASFPLFSHAQTPSRLECSFVGIKEADRVGKNSSYPDGKADAVFSLTFPKVVPNQTVSEIELRAAQPPGLWSSSKPGAKVGYIGIARAKSPSDIVNPRGGPVNLSPETDSPLLLFVTDDGQFASKKRSFQVRVVNSDGTSWTTAVAMETSAAARSQAPAPSGVYPVRMSAQGKGISNYDAVGVSRKIGGDEKADGLILLNVEADDKTITGIEIRNVDGTRSVWDTVPSSTNPPIGVASINDPVRLLNKSDGSVRIDVKGRLDLNLYVADNGSLEAGQTNYRVTVTFADGGISWCPVQAASRSDQKGPEEKTEKPKTNAHFLASWLGYVATDAVGLYPEMKPDGKPDAVFGLDIQLIPKGVITGIELTSLDGTSRRWTTSGGPGTWGLGVAYQASSQALINRADGSVRIPLDERTQFYLYAADPGDLSSIQHNLRLVVHLDDGSSFQQFVRWPAAPTPTVVPGAPEEPQARARGIITCEFRGFIADLVNTSTRPQKDGYLDGTFIMKLQVDDKKLAKVEIASGDGVVRWSSNPRPPVMFLGVAAYPKIYVLMNPQGGAMATPISGRRTLYLYAADNGMLSDPKSRLIATVTFTDNSTLSAEVIK